MRLLGTTTSPYARKARILLEAAELAYTFLDTRLPAGAGLLAQLAPLGKIPVLVTASSSGGVTVLADSSLIAQWVWDRASDTLRSAGWNLDPTDWEDRGLQVIVEGSMDAAINHRYLTLDGVSETGYLAKQKQRVERTLTHLEERMVFRRPIGAAALSLGCMLDWMVFRNIADLSRWPGLTVFRRAWIDAGVGSGSEPRGKATPSRRWTERR